MLAMASKLEEESLLEKKYFLEFSKVEDVVSILG